MTLSPNTFTGEYSYSLDSKGRVNIPARYRQVLSNDNKNTFITTRGQDACVWVYPMIEWKKIEIWNPEILKLVDKKNMELDPNEFNELSGKIVI